MAQKNKVEVILSLLDEASKPFERFNAKLAGMTRPLQQINNRLVMLGKESGLNRVANQLGAVGSAAGNVAGKLAMVGGAAVGAGFIFKRAFIDVAAEFERFEAILTTIEGDSGKAKKAMSWIGDFAAKTPYELTEVTDAFVKLRAYGMEPTNGLLKSLGDTAAAMGKPIMQAVEAIADAVTGENERLKEFGIKAKKTGDKIVYEYTENGKTMRAAAKASNRAQIQATLEAIFNKKYAGAMDKLSGTWGGMMSNISDQWTRFAKMVMDSGPFEILRGKLAAFLGKLDAMAKSGELAKIAEEWGRKISEAFTVIWTTGQRIYNFIASFIDRVGGLENAMLILAAVAAGPLILALVMLGQSFILLAAALAGPMLMALTGMGKAFLLLGRIMLLTPIGWFMAAVALMAGAAYLIYKNWEPIKTWFSELWADITATFQKSIDFIIDKIDFIGKKWQNTKAFFGFGDEPTTPAGGRGNGYSTGGGFGGEWTPGPAANVMGATKQAVGGSTTQTTTNNAKVEIDFKNVPRGTDVKPARGNTAPLDLNMGYSGQW